MITELSTRNLMGGELYISLKEWRSNESDPDTVEAGVEALSKAFAARVFMKRSGLRYDQLRRDTTYHQRIYRWQLTTSLHDRGGTSKSRVLCTTCVKQAKI